MNEMSPKTSDKITAPKIKFRDFNVCDIFGDLDFGIDGLPLLRLNQNTDKQGRSINKMGYLTNKDGDIIDNQKLEKQFEADELDGKGDLLPPYNIEKYNFNAH